jgi:hypothetical protein
MASRKYQKHTHHQHILELPDTYVGSTQTNEETRWVYDGDSNKMVWRKLIYNPGLYKIFDEILVNARDEYVRSITTAEMTPIKHIGISITSNGEGDTIISVENDGSTLEFTTTGLLTDLQKAELVKQGDQFGFSMAMNRDGSILVIGAPNSDGQYFANYRGIWRGDVEYVEGEVVRYQGSPGDSYQYYQLGDAFLSPDSTYRSYNEDPSNSANWQQVGDSTAVASGKIFVYKKTSYDSYELTQMINAGSLSSFTDIDSGLVISTGDQFGFSMDIDSAELR